MKDDIDDLSDDEEEEGKDEVGRVLCSEKRQTNKQTYHSKYKRSTIASLATFRLITINCLIFIKPGELNIAENNLFPVAVFFYIYTLKSSIRKTTTTGVKVYCVLN